MIDTPDLADRLHRPDQSAAGWTVFAFDRDYTIDVNPPRDEDREPVPIEWVGYLAHETDHIVYATGNQMLKREASIPGIAEIVDAHPEGDLEEDVRSVTVRPDRDERVQMLGDLYPDAEELIVVDDADLSHLREWEYYPSWEFMPAARDGRVLEELPPAADELESTSEYLDPQPRGAMF